MQYGAVIMVVCAIDIDHYPGIEIVYTAIVYIKMHVHKYR